MNNKIVYRNIPYGAKENCITTATSKQPFVDMEDLKRDFEVPNYATLEKNRWALNGNFLVFPDTPQNIKYISELMSDENGYFNEDIILTRTYSNNYTSPRFKFYF